MAFFTGQSGAANEMRKHALKFHESEFASANAPREFHKHATRTRIVSYASTQDMKDVTQATSSRIRASAPEQVRAIQRGASWYETTSERSKPTPNQPVKFKTIASEQERPVKNAIASMAFASFSLCSSWHSIVSNSGLICEPCQLVIDWLNDWPIDLNIQKQAM